ncbi:ATP-dependent RNA helicase CshA [invertebrate metagenome]|uniref:ATP-dependent RNA helicase CshA n=1 Tax=invertebrate metagenome TaxID=1711999 RepID=A0A2H9T5W1_9ZZZZ
MFSDLNLNTRLLKALDALNFKTPTPIQEQTIPIALSGNDLQAGAETGSGKTAAFLLPTLHQLIEKRSKKSGPRALVLLPTRELTTQVLKAQQSMAKFSRIMATTVTGGASFRYQIASLRKNPEILIATPGRLLDHLNRGTVSLKDVEVLILDEADRMLDMGFSEDVLQIADHCPTERQTLLFSATMDQPGLKKITDKLLNNPQIVNLGTTRNPNKNIEQRIILSDDAPHKEKLLTAILESTSFGKAVVFTNTRVQAEALSRSLHRQKHRVGALHGNMTQGERNRVMAKLRNGSINILVATDVAARGLDVKGVGLVVNFDLTRSGDDYIHRIGRTGRAGEKGLAISLVGPADWTSMIRIERYLKVSFDRHIIEGLEANYKGPKRIKSSGKPAGRKRRPINKNRPSKSTGKPFSPKGKNTQKPRQSVNKGKTSQKQPTGFAPIKKRPAKRAANHQ